MSPSSRRLERINSVMRAEIADIIRNEVKDPRITFVSVTAVETAADLSHAKVLVSVLGTEEEKKRNLEALVRAAAFVREKLLHRLEIRKIPHLEFVLDENIEYSIRISGVISRLNVPPGDRSE